MANSSAEDLKLGTWPRPWRLARALLRAPSPFVMVDLLAFREQATGEFASMSGREAYQRYARSAEASQGRVAARVLWSGELEAVEDDRPPFEVATLVQYESPRAFLRSLTRRGSDDKARKAGLVGQSLIAAEAMDSAPWDVTDRTTLVELVGLGKDGESWRTARRTACTGLDGELIWRGRAIEQLIGAGPRIDEIVVTGFADEEARLAGIEALAGVARDTHVVTWWAYAATEHTEMPGPSR